MSIYISYSIVLNVCFYTYFTLPLPPKKVVASPLSKLEIVTFLRNIHFWNSIGVFLNTLEDPPHVCVYRDMVGFSVFHTPVMIIIAKRKREKTIFSKKEIVF